MVLVHEPFAVIAQTQCRVLGAVDPLIIVYKQDAPAFETDEASDQKAHSVAADVLRALTSQRA